MKCGQSCTLHILISLQEPPSKELVLSRLMNLKFLPVLVSNDHAQILSQSMLQRTVMAALKIQAHPPC